MSKASLKKELKNFDAEQLRSLVLDLYSARKEVKEYLEFFLDPDVEALSEKYSKAIYKELNRVKKRALSPRWSKIRTLIKEFASFKPGEDEVIKLMNYTFTTSVIDFANYYVADSYKAGLMKHFETLYELANKNGLIDIAMPVIIQNLEILKNSKVYGRKETGYEMKLIIENIKPF